MESILQSIPFAPLESTALSETQVSFSLLQQLSIKKTSAYFAKTTLSVSVLKLCSNDYCAVLHFNNSNKPWNIMISMAK